MAEELGIAGAGAGPDEADAPVWEATVEPDGGPSDLAVPGESWIQGKVADWRERHRDARNAPGGWAYTVRHWEPPSIATYEQAVPDGADLAAVKALVTLLYLVTDPRRRARAIAAVAVALIVLAAAGVLLGARL
jgi:hypothetical protein